MPNRSTFAPPFGGLLHLLGVAAFLLAPFTSSTLSAQEFGSGPYHFQNFNIGGGGGFIPGIVFSTTEPGLVYARTDIGGAYRFNPQSGTWTPLLDWIGFPDWNLSAASKALLSTHATPTACISRSEPTPTNGRAKTARSCALPTRVTPSNGLTCPSRSAATCLPAAWASASQTIPTTLAFFT
jgi:hypothetical protein